MKLDPIDRLVMNTQVSETGFYSDTPCIEWTGRVDEKGYGRFYADGKHRKAHRYLYEKLVEPVPDGLELDHLCRNRCCVNLDHLEAVTHEQNMSRGAHAMKQVCARGHPYEGDNIYYRPNGRGRACKECRRENLQRFRERHR